MSTGSAVDDRHRRSIGSRVAAVKRQTVRRWLLWLLPAVAMAPAAVAWAGTEFEPAARLIFPYYDIRPGTVTTLFLTNAGAVPASARLTFYDQSCLATGRSIPLSPRKIAAIDLGRLFDGATGTFTQGFVDVETTPNSLAGVATILNLTEDWAISYPAAPARRLSGQFPFEPFPPRLSVPGFFAGTPGPRVLDGLLILVAPHPTISGGPIAPDAVQASVDVVGASGLGTSLAATGHQLVLPLSSLTDGLSPDDAVAWAMVENHAVDEAGQPPGLVGLFIQTLVDPAGGGGMAGAVRLWSLP